MTTALAILTDVEFQAKTDMSDNKTTWILRSLSGLELLECTRRGYVDHAEIIHKGLTGWKDFYDSNGVAIEFKQDNIGRINGLILQELSYEIQELSSMTEDERKN